MKINFLTRFLSLSFLIILLSCGPGPKKTTIFDTYPFDEQVIKRLPVYDSLANVLLNNISELNNHINTDDSYRAYRYRLQWDSSDLSKKIPEGEAQKIQQLFDKLGKNFAFGFDLFKDSTIKIYIRSDFSEKEQVSINENLSYYPTGTKMKHREFPIKDTILNDHWQYWIAFEGRGPFH